MSDFEEISTGKVYEGDLFREMTNAELLRLYDSAELSHAQETLLLVEIESRFEFYRVTGQIPKDDTAADTYHRPDYLAAKEEIIKA